MCGKDQRVAEALLLCCRHAGVKGDKPCNMCSANIWLIRTLCKQFTRRFDVCSHAGVREVKNQELNITRHLCGCVRVFTRVCLLRNNQSLLTSAGKERECRGSMEQMCPTDYCSVFVLMWSIFSSVSLPRLCVPGKISSSCGWELPVSSSSGLVNHRGLADQTETDN